MATTWTTPAAIIDTGRFRVAKGACSNGTETAVQGPGSTAGIDLKGLASVTAYLEMARATGTITCAAVAAGDTVTVNGAQFTAVANSATPTSAQFRIGAAGDGQNAECAANIAAAINASTNASLVGLITATSALAVVTVSAYSPGTAGNARSLVSSNGTRLAVSGATLAGGTDIGSGATLQCWLYNPYTQVWSRAQDLDLTATASQGSQGFTAMWVNGPASRVKYLPNAVGTACTVYLIGTAARLK